MNEQLRKRFESLRAIAPQLNEASNAAQASLREVEKALNDLNLGIDVEAGYFYREDADGDGIVRERVLVYGRFSGRFCIHVVERVERWVEDGPVSDDGDYYPEILSEERYDWSSLNREDKLASVERLDAIVMAVESEAMRLLTRATAVATRAAGCASSLKPCPE
jgi:hypothetical protein